MSGDRRRRATDHTGVAPDGGATDPAPPRREPAEVHTEVREAIGEEARWGPTVGDDFLPGHSFALCLTHDVDRPYKRVQALYYALRERDPSHLRALVPGRAPNWQFDAVASMEADMGVRSAFYVLDEQRLLRDRPLRDLADPEAWRLFADRYDVEDPAIGAEIRDLDARGFEVGLHGSYESFDDRERLRAEKERVEAVLGHGVRGGRQHYLNRTLPETWEHHAAIGLDYDATVGSSTTYGFQYGDTVLRPFGDDFVAFPLTIMEVALPDPGERPREAWTACEAVLEEAVDRGAIATVLWHPRFFNERDWPGYARLYRRLVEHALDLGAWVGPPGECYDLLQQHEADTAEAGGTEAGGSGAGDSDASDAGADGTDAGTPTDVASDGAGEG